MHHVQLLFRWSLYKSENIVDKQCFVNDGHKTFWYIIINWFWLNKNWLQNCMCMRFEWQGGRFFFVMWGVNGDIVPPRCHVLWNMLAAFVSLWLVLLFWQFHTMVPSCTMMLSSPSQYDCWNSGLHGSILTWDTWIAQPWDTANAHSKEDTRSQISGDFFFYL